MYSVEEAVARFFPIGGGYDREQAQRLIRWLESCGYEIAPKQLEELVGVQLKTLPPCLRIETFIGDWNP